MTPRKVDEYDAFCGWHLTDPDGWQDVKDAMRDDPPAPDERETVWSVPGWPCRVWTDGDATWVDACDAIHAVGVELVEPIDSYRVLVVFTSGDTAEMLRGERLFVEADR